MSRTTPGHFLWPQPRPLQGRHFLARSGTAWVEGRLAELFPGTCPVLFSSARAGLAGVLQVLGVGRPDFVWVPPFSSHCLLDVVGRYGTPTVRPGDHPAAAVIYHQWGYPQRADFPAGCALIEDAVDTLFRPGASVFRCGGRFALWSLPKIIGSLFGGVVFCAGTDDAEALKRVRGAAALPPSHAWLKVIGKRFPLASQYWNDVEPRGGSLPGFALAQIRELLEGMEALVAEREAFFGALAEAAGLKRPEAACFPSNIPLEVGGGNSLWSPEGRFNAGFRSFNVAGRSPGVEMRRVAPLPVHRDVRLEDVADVVEKLAQRQWHVVDAAPLKSDQQQNISNGHCL